MADNDASVRQTVKAARWRCSDQDVADTKEMIRGYECPECGPLDPETFSLREMDDILGGDENGFLRCPDCDEELEPTLEAALDMLDLISERMPEVSP